MFLPTTTLAGSGVIRANGGSSLETSSGGGGGGRAALLADSLSFTGSLSATGGTGFQAGGAGTIFTRVTAESAGRLLSLNNAGRAGYTPLSSTNAPTGLLYSLDVARSAILGRSITEKYALSLVDRMNGMGLNSVAAILLYCKLQPRYHERDDKHDGAVFRLVEGLITRHAAEAARLLHEPHAYFENDERPNMRRLRELLRG